MHTLEIKNNQAVPLSLIPVFDYDVFFAITLNFMKEADMHCVNYYALPYGSKLKFICCIADDAKHTIHVFSHELYTAQSTTLDAISAEVYAFHIFEREISENFGIDFLGHPWLKPVRYAFDRKDKSKTLLNYPFYKLDSDETHEVGVGPIHAGVIEPGHFRFLCLGETVHHLEIQLGYQHRGIENIFLKKPHLLQRTVLAESIAGDTAVGHTLAFVNNMESLYGVERNKKLDMIRVLALELERIAIHTGDLSAFCLDIAYQLGNSVFGALRTPLINYFQFWCGNRFGKGLIRTGYNPYPFTLELRERLVKMLEDFETKYLEMAEKTFEMPSVLNRFEKTGELTAEQAKLIGAVGMAARMTGIKRDIRVSHPFNYFEHLEYEAITLETGDVYARGMLRNKEIQQSLAYIRTLLTQIYTLPEEPVEPRFDLYDKKLKADHLCLSLTEGWRGEICHTAITGQNGEIIHYKIKDPSFHNWLALALTVRDNEISDFPICNKSFNLSYCGNDL